MQLYLDEILKAANGRKKGQGNVAQVQSRALPAMHFVGLTLHTLCQPAPDSNWMDSWMDGYNNLFFHLEDAPSQSAI